MTSLYQPKPEHKFTFGLWTVGDPAATRLAKRFGRLCRRSRSSICWPKSAHGGLTSMTMTSSQSMRRLPSAIRSWLISNKR